MSSCPWFTYIWLDSSECVVSTLYKYNELIAQRSKEHSKFRRDACYRLGIGDLVDKDKIRVNKGASQYNAASLISSR
jgi:hypothetical protein